MLDWGQGYHIDIPYMVGFYPDLAPVHIKSALLLPASKLTSRGPVRPIANWDAVMG